MVKDIMRKIVSPDDFWAQLRSELEPIVEKYEKDYGIVIDTLTYTKNRTREFSTKVRGFVNISCDITV